MQTPEGIFLSWNMLGALTVMFTAIQGIGIIIVRAVVQAEIRKWARPKGECDLLHMEIDRRLEKIEGALE